MTVKEVSVQELKRRLDAGEKFQLLDVREPWEIAIARLPGSIHIPLGQLSARLSELQTDSDLIVMCRSGGRSHRATELLLTRGFDRAANLTGGINAWADEIDPDLPTY
jgi:sulfur-carrier protein adenylyltransferase/sulfurtransferase